MIRRGVPLLLFSILACAPAAPPAEVKIAAGPPRFGATSIARRVVLLSFDGLGADALARQQNLPAFERLARDGASARVINVNPTMTSSTHVSILTGADPQRHGIVSNRFHIAGTPPEQIAMGMQTDPDVETIVEAARRQGKRVGVVPFPSIDNATPRRSADFGLAWTRPLVRSSVIQLTRADFRREWVPPTWTDRPQRRRSFSPIMRARLEWRIPRTAAPALRIDVDLVAYDTTNDAATNYDSYYVESGEREIDVDDNGWFALSHDTGDGLYGSWSKILDASDALEITLYRGPVQRNEAWPASFRDMLDREIGFWPGMPEDEGVVDTTTFLEQLERAADFYRRAQTLAITRMGFDLLLLYHPAIDSASHRYLGTAEEERAVRAAFVAADRSIDAVAEALDTSDALIVTGDHGVIAADREVRVNRLLSENGFTPRWRAYLAGNVAHLYRFAAPDDSDAIVNLLTSTGAFERVEKKNAGMHPNSGDVIAWGLPQYAMSMSEEAPAIAPRVSRGQHGSLNIHRELHTVLFAYGAGVPGGGFGEIAQTKIARFVAELLGIEAPSAAE